MIAHKESFTEEGCWPGSYKLWPLCGRVTSAKLKPRWKDVTCKRCLSRRTQPQEPRK